MLWTNRSEFVSYAELYNSFQDDIRVVVVYKKDLLSSLPPAKDEVPPDLVVSSYLANSTLCKYFIPLDYLFSQMLLDRDNFYPQLLHSGTIDNKLYFLPVSFNLPAMIFAEKNKDLLDNEYTISLEGIKTKASEYNRLNKANIFTAMGFSPRWNMNFAYLATRLRGSAFHENNSTVFSYQSQKFDQTVKYLRNWTLEANKDSASEDDFKFKYLYTPGYTLVTTDRCLFALTRSDELFNLNSEKLSGIDYRWVCENTIPVEDDFVSLGMYKKTRNINTAESFITWLMNKDTQKRMIERTIEMKLNTTTFGIAGGFSSIKQVNERFFPLFYPMLIRNIPSAEKISEPEILPALWPDIKEKILLPYLEDSLNTKHEINYNLMNILIAEWNKQLF